MRIKRRMCEKLIDKFDAYMKRPCSAKIHKLQKQLNKRQILTSEKLKVISFNRHSIHILAYKPRDFQVRLIFFLSYKLEAFFHQAWYNRLFVSLDFLHGFVFCILQRDCVFCLYVLFAPFLSSCWFHFQSGILISNLLPLKTPKFA